MLTAMLSEGTKICLAHKYERSILEELRRREHFHCPSCGERVILKLGERKIYHFSHVKAGCEESRYERESQYHLAGKLALYNWLKQQNIEAELELYDKQIRQRPDITFYYKNCRYALEFQCTTIPDHVFIKRTENYLHNGYIPLWILGGTHLPKMLYHSITLSGFDYLFYRSSTQGPGYIPYFCPDKNEFNIIHSICPASPSKALAAMKKMNVKQASLTSIVTLPPIAPHPTNLWLKKLERSKLGIGANPNTPYMHFLKELYRKGLNVFLLCPELGQPGYFSLPFVSCPVIWQSYIYLDSLSGLDPGRILTVKEVVGNLKLRVDRGDIILRPLPLAGDMTIEAAVYEYLLRLTISGILSKRHDGSFIFQKKMAFPKTSAAQAAMMEKFYLGN